MWLLNQSQTAMQSWSIPGSGGNSVGPYPHVVSPSARLTRLSGVSGAAAFPKLEVQCLAEPWVVL